MGGSVASFALVVVAVVVVVVVVVVAAFSVVTVFFKEFYICTYNSCLFIIS
jgi:hypothetical protein